MNHRELIDIEGRYVQSTLDDDLYKLNMQYAAFHLFPKAKVRWKYILRSDVDFPDGFGAVLRDIVQQFSRLTAPEHAEDFLYTRCSYLPPTFINFLLNFRFNPSEVGIVQRGGELEIDIEGYYFSATRWEVTLMATISELYFLMTGQADGIDIERVNNTTEKAQHMRLSAIYFAEFGTRRRFSYANQLLTVQKCKKAGWGGNFLGTSNVHIALQEDLRPIGTQGHEWFMFHLAMYGARMANTMAMHNWADVFNGDNGIVLPDTFTSNEFLKVFDKRMSKLYDGVRWDSGTHQEFTDKFVAHYKGMNIDHTAKSYVYSNGINSLDIAKEIVGYASRTHGIPRENLPLGIGTWLTNDVGVKPLNQVIKMWSAQPIPDGRWINVCKISDSFGKVTGEEEEANLTMKMLGVNLEDLQRKEEPVQA